MTEQTLLLNCDWLGLSMQLAGEPQPLKGYQWREYTATNIWNKRRVLWTEDGDRVLTLLSEPRSSIINSRAALCEIENEWLYHGGGYSRILDLLSQSVLYHITGISRVDLALDFCPTEAQKDIIIGLATGEYYVKGKANRVPWWGIPKGEKLHPMWRGKNIPYDQSWGHKTSSIKWKLYYKTKELLDAGGGKFMMKPYIIDRWRENGMDTSNVWRVEVSLHKTNGYTLYGNRLDLDNLQRNFLELFLQLYDSRFKIRWNEGHVDRTNDKVVTFLPVRKIQYTMQIKPPTTDRQHNGRITLLRHLVQSLDEEQVLLDAKSRTAVFNHIAQIIERDNLENYFFAMTGYWYDEYITMKDAQANGSEMIPLNRPTQNADIQPNAKGETYDSSTEKEYWAMVSKKVESELGIGSRKVLRE